MPARRWAGWSPKSSRRERSPAAPARPKNRLWRGPRWRSPRREARSIDLLSCVLPSEGVAGLEPETKFFEIVVEHEAVDEGPRHRIAVHCCPGHLPQRGRGEEEP